MSDMHVIQERLGVSNPDAAKNITALVRHILRLRALRRGEADQANPLKWQSIARFLAEIYSTPITTCVSTRYRMWHAEISHRSLRALDSPKGNATGERDGVASKDVA